MTEYEAEKSAHRVATIIFLTFLLFGMYAVYASISEPKQNIYTCFVPSQRCDILLAQKIDKAKMSIDVQAYHITNHVIINALMDAENRGVKVD